MARHWRMLPVPGFFDCSWAECDVDRGRLVATRKVLECANLLLEGNFRALYVPLGGSKTRMERITSKSMKFYISMFNDKPPCMPICFDIAVIILPKAVGAFSFFISSFLASTTEAFSISSFLASSSTFSFFLAFFFHFLFLFRFFLPLFLLS